MNLSTTYMGLDLGSPLVASASPLTGEVESIRRLESCGASAIVLHSLFEEQLAHDADQLEHYLSYGAERFPESLTYFPREPQYRLGAEEYLDLVRNAKAAVSVPVIASLNGVSQRTWTDYARNIQDAGADAVECNVYYVATDPTSTAQQVEDRYLGVLKTLKSAVTIPVAMKLSPFFSATANMLTRLDQAGADALVLFNRFYQPDLDVEDLEVRPRLTLSTSAECRLPLRWIAIMHGRVRASLAATTGIHTGLDAAKMILAGADVTMMTSALLERGPEHLGVVRQELVSIMESKGYESIAEMKGVLSQRKCPNPAAFERANYMKTLASYGMTATRE